jgi:DNA-directed RNA polymerase specialized sigma24 family protein
VAKIHRGKTFDYHTKTDIEQQVWVIAIEALPKYENKKTKTKNPELAFESWINAVVSRRLKNFYRDRYTVKHREKANDSNFDKIKKNNLSRPLDLGLAESVVGTIDVPHFSEMDLNTILNQLPDDLRQVLLLQLSGIHIVGYYTYRLNAKLKEIYEAKVS